jgi:hypothetical protein
MTKSLIWVISMVLVAVFLVSCGAPAPTPTPLPTSTPTPVPTPTPTPLPPSAQAIMTAALDAQQAAESYHFDMDALVSMTGDAVGGTMKVPFNFAGDFQAPDRMQGTMKATAQGVTVETGMTMIGTDVWIKDPTTGQWVASPQSAVPFTPQEFTKLDPSVLQNLQFVGEESLDGTPTYHLTTQTSAPLDLGEPLGQIQLDMKAGYWIDSETDLVRKITVGGTVPTTGTVQLTIGLSMTIQFSDYGVPVTIEPPPTATP